MGIVRQLSERAQQLQLPGTLLANTFETLSADLRGNNFEVCVRNS